MRASAHVGGQGSAPGRAARPSTRTHARTHQPTPTHTCPSSAAACSTESCLQKKNSVSSSACWAKARSSDLRDGRGRAGGVLPLSLALPCRSCPARAAGREGGALPPIPPPAPQLCPSPALNAPWRGGQACTTHWKLSPGRCPANTSRCSNSGKMPAVGVRSDSNGVCGGGSSRRGARGRDRGWGQGGGSARAGGSAAAAPATAGAAALQTCTPSGAAHARATA